MTGQALASKPSEAEKLRRQAGHLCSDDVQTSCDDATPDEDKVKGCMQVHHTRLSPAWAKVDDQGLGG